MNYYYLLPVVGIVLPGGEGWCEWGLGDNMKWFGLYYISFTFIIALKTKNNSSVMVHL